MNPPKTMEELIKGIDALAMKFDWKPDDFSAVLYLMYENGNTCYNMFGNGCAMVNALLNMMIHDEKFRRVVFAAHESYVDYMSKKYEPTYKAIAEKIEKIQKDLLTPSGNAEVPCLYSAKFKPKS